MADITNQSLFSLTVHSSEALELSSCMALWAIIPRQGITQKCLTSLLVGQQSYPTGINHCQCRQGLVLVLAWEIPAGRCKLGTQFEIFTGNTPGVTRWLCCRILPDSRLRPCRSTSASLCLGPGTGTSPCVVRGSDRPPESVLLA